MRLLSAEEVLPKREEPKREESKREEPKWEEPGLWEQEEPC